MAKAAKKLQKSIKQVKEKQKEEYPLKNQILYFAKILYLIIIISILMYGVTTILNGSYKLQGTSKIKYSTILASQSFNKGKEKYYVVFYDFDTNADITTKIEEITKSKVYKINLGDKLNASILSNKSNKEADASDELKINGVTLIEIYEGKNIDYVEGKENVVSFLGKL